MTEELVLVTGGTGFIGRHVLKALLENVHTFEFICN